MRHRLPKDLKFSGSMKGIKAQSKDMVKTLISSGKYIETALKITSNIQASRDIAGSNVIEELRCSATLAALPQEQGQQVTGFRRENTFGRLFQQQSFRGRGRGFSSFGQNFSLSMNGHNENNYGFRTQTSAK